MKPLRSTVSLHWIATFLLLVTTLTASRLMARRRSEFLIQPLNTIDRQIAGFTAADNPVLTDEVLAQLKPTSYLSRTYNKSGLQADLFIAFYAQQRAGESMHSPKHCLPGAGWEIFDYASAAIPAGGRRYKVNKYRVSRETERRLVLYWYQSKQRIIANEYLGKLLLAHDALLQNSTSGSIVRIIVPDRPGAFEAARELASAIILQVQRCFGG
jgi:EpsI family protein